LRRSRSSGRTTSVNPRQTRSSRKKEVSFVVIASTTADRTVTLRDRSWLTTAPTSSSPSLRATGVRRVSQRYSFPGSSTMPASASRKSWR
jgi:hypothetical protein